MGCLWCYLGNKSFNIKKNDKMTKILYINAIRIKKKKKNLGYIGKTLKTILSFGILSFLTEIKDLFIGILLINTIGNGKCSRTL